MIRKLCYTWICIWFALSISANIFKTPHELNRSLQAGYDAFGRPLIAVLLKASSASCLFALTAAIVSGIGALLIASMVSFLPKRSQFAFDRLLEVLLSFPSILLGLAWAARFGPGWGTLVVALTLGTLPALTRIVRARIKDIQHELYIEASLALGTPPFELIKRHYFPAMIGLLSVKLPSYFASALLAEASLSFFGLGAPIGRDTWGALLAQGKDYLLEAPHIAFMTGVPLVLTVLSLQLLSEQISEKKV